MVDLTIAESEIVGEISIESVEAVVDGRVDEYGRVRAGAKYDGADAVILLTNTDDDEPEDTDE